MIQYLALALTVFLATDGTSRPLKKKRAKPRFDIYLLANSKLNAVDASRRPLARLRLAPRPLLTLSDIVRYKWKTHTISLKRNSLKRLKAQRLDRDVHGVPFVVVVTGGKRVYLGGFWTDLSSASFSNPVIVFRRTGLKLERAYPTPRFGRGPDPRLHPKIYAALKAAHKL